MCRRHTFYITPHASVGQQPSEHHMPRHILPRRTHADGVPEAHILYNPARQCGALEHATLPNHALRAGR